MHGYAVTQYADGTTGYRAVASEDEVQPGESFASEPPAPSLAEIQLTLCAQIDGAADAAYVAIGGPSPGRLAEYKQAKADADAFKASGYASSAPDTIACWAEANGWSEQQACDDILSTAESWEAALAAIRRLRLIGKSNVGAASDAGAAQAAADAAMSAIQSIPSGAA